MRKVIQEQKTKTICDISGKELIYDACCFDFSLFVYEKGYMEELIKEEGREKGKRLNKKEKREVINTHGDIKNIEMHLKPQIGYEILEFLRQKYPKQIKKFLKTKFIGENDVIEPVELN